MRHPPMSGGPMKLRTSIFSWNVTARPLRYVGQQSFQNDAHDVFHAHICRFHPNSAESGPSGRIWGASRRPRAEVVLTWAEVGPRSAKFEANSIDVGSICLQSADSRAVFDQMRFALTKARLIRRKLTRVRPNLADSDKMAPHMKPRTMISLAGYSAIRCGVRCSGRSADSVPRPLELVFRLALSSVGLVGSEGAAGPPIASRGEAGLLWRVQRLFLQVLQGKVVPLLALYERNWQVVGMYMRIPGEPHSKGYPRFEYNLEASPQSWGARGTRLASPRCVRGGGGGVGAPQHSEPFCLGGPSMAVVESCRPWLGATAGSDRRRGCRMRTKGSSGRVNSGGSTS